MEESGAHKNVLVGSLFEASRHIDHNFWAHIKLAALPFLLSYISSALGYELFYKEGSPLEFAYKYQLLGLDTLFYTLSYLIYAPLYAISIHRFVLLGKLDQIQQLRNPNILFWGVAGLEFMPWLLLSTIPKAPILPMSITDDLVAQHTNQLFYSSNYFIYAMAFCFVFLIFFAWWISSRLATVFPHIATVDKSERNIKNSFSISSPYIRSIFWRLLSIVFIVSFFNQCILFVIDTDIIPADWQYDVLWSVNEALHEILFLMFTATFASVAYRRLK